MKIRIAETFYQKDAEDLIIKTGADPASVKIMAPKAVLANLFIENIDNRAAAIIKQYALSEDADAAVSWKVSCFKKGFSDVFLMATKKQAIRISAKLKDQHFGLNEAAEQITKTLASYEKNKFILKSGTKKIVLEDTPAIMGILNVTPDSFCDGGRYTGTEQALARALEMAAEGAEIIDIGGESSRPGAKVVSEKEELSRILPVLKKLAKKTKAMISIDTYKPEVAKACLSEGADIINDISAMRHKKGKMAQIISCSKVPVVLMHMKGTPATMQKDPQYKDVVGDIIEFFEKRTVFAEKCGIPRERIVIDPGIGFGKTAGHNHFWAE